MVIVSAVNDPAASRSYIWETDPVLYNAAVEGNIQSFRQTDQSLRLLDLVTPNNGTILHIHITSSRRSPNSIEFVKQILEICPLLLQQINANHDTPLHIAAKYGRNEIAAVLIERAKEVGAEAAAVSEMLSMKNNQGNTALHEAVRTCNLPLVIVLTTALADNASFSYSANHSGETPLYMAAERGSLPMVTQLLGTCQSAAHEGPHGRSALHAAVLIGDLDITTKIIEMKKSLTKEKDKDGWTPLHCAAYYGHLPIARKLLESDRSVAYAADNDKRMTALHLAASQGNEEIMRAIIEHCPDCSEMVNELDWNFLHFAFISLSLKEASSFLKNPSIQNVGRNLIHGKDANGNTPLQNYLASREIMELVVRMGKKLKITAFDNPYFKWQDVLLQSTSELQRQIKELAKPTGPYRRGLAGKVRVVNEDDRARLEKLSAQHVIVAILIATVTFAAAFTMPGGYKSEEGPDYSDQQGTAILTRKAAFQAFVISDSLAMVLSLFAVLAHFDFNIKFLAELRYLPEYAYFATFVAMVLMVVAFVTGTYAVLTSYSGLAIATCCIGLSFFLLYLITTVTLGILAIIV